jgi:glutathione S-transferase
VVHKTQRQRTTWCTKRSAQAPQSAAPVVAVDHDNDDFAMFESGAILMYLAQKAGQLYPQDFNKRSEVNQWLFFQTAGLGPMQGQAAHFAKFAPERIEYGIQRYTNETKRLYAVLEDRLKDNEWLAAGEYTIAGA